MINMLRDFRQKDPKKWLKPSDFMEFMVGFYALETYFTKEAAGIREVFGQSVPEFMSELSTKRSAANMNPGNEQLKPRYVWKPDELTQWHTLKRSFKL